MTKFKKAAYVMNQANQQAAMDDGYGWYVNRKTLRHLDKEVLWTEENSHLEHSSRRFAEKDEGFEVHEHYPTIDPALNKEENIMKQEFTKADLKTGMVVTLQDGHKYNVLLDTTLGDVLRKVGSTSYRNMDKYYDYYLAHSIDKKADVVEVEDCDYRYSLLTGNTDRTIWERKELSEAEIKLQELKELHKETAKKIAELSKEMEGGTL